MVPEPRGFQDPPGTPEPTRTPEPQWLWGSLTPTDSFTKTLKTDLRAGLNDSVIWQPRPLRMNCMNLQADHRLTLEPLFPSVLPCYYYLYVTPFIFWMYFCRWDLQVQHHRMDSGGCLLCVRVCVCLTWELRLSFLQEGKKNEMLLMHWPAAMSRFWRGRVSPPGLKSFLYYCTPHCSFIYSGYLCFTFPIVKQGVTVDQQQLPCSVFCSRQLCSTRAT